MYLKRKKDYCSFECCNKKSTFLWYVKPKKWKIEKKLSKKILSVNTNITPTSFTDKHTSTTQKELKMYDSKNEKDIPY